MKKRVLADLENSTSNDDGAVAVKRAKSSATSSTAAVASADASADAAVPFTGLAADCCDAYGNAGISTRLEVEEVQFWDGDDDEFEWRLTLHGLNTLRLAVKINSTILSRIHFFVKVHGEARDNFCVLSTPLKTLLTQLDNNVGVVHLRRRRHEDDIEIEATHLGVRTVHKLQTIVTPGEQEDEMLNLKGQYEIEINLPHLKTIVKGASSLNAHWLTIQLHRAQVGDVVHSLVTLLCTGEGASSKYDFYSRSTIASGDGGGFANFTTISDEAAMDIPTDVKFEQLMTNSYDVLYLRHILKNMDGEEISLSLAPSFPLIFTYMLGTDRSYIRCVLSPKQATYESEEEEDM